MLSNSIFVGNLIDDLLEELNLRIFHGIYHFLPVLTEILENFHLFSFFTAFYAPIGVKKCVLSYEGKNVLEFHTCWKSN